MANRRMFAKHITRSSRFLRMPISSRLLYYDLGMEADDDGYCEWYPILQTNGGTQQDLEVLAANKFVKVFDDDVLIIKDWTENNYLRSDRYQPSQYLEKYPMTELGIPTGIPVVDRLATQDRIGKVRLGKSKENTTREFVTTNLEKYKSSYPNVDLELEWQRCQDYYAAKGKTIKDWSAAFRNWLSSPFEKRKSNNLGPRVT